MKKETNQTVDRALALLSLFSEEEELGISEISLAMGIDRTSISRLVSSLEKADFLQKNEETRKYRLGMRLLYLGMLVEERNELAMQALPFMKQLSEQFQVTSLLSTLENNQVRVLHKVSAGPVVYMSARVGLLLPAYCMASGKLLLAYSGTENIQSYLSNTPLSAMTRNTIVDPALLSEEFQRILLQGFAEDNGEATIGLSCISVPVYGPQRRVIAAFSLSGQSEIVQSNRLAMLNSLKNVSLQLSN